MWWGRSRRGCEGGGHGRRQVPGVVAWCRLVARWGPGRVRVGREREEERSSWERGAVGLGGGRRWGTAIEPLAKGVNGNLAEVTELDVRQSRAMEVRDDGRPVELAGCPSHGGISGNRGTGPIVTRSRWSLKMGSPDASVQQGQSQVEQSRHQIPLDLVDAASFIHGRLNRIDELMKLGSGLEESLFLVHDHGGSLGRGANVGLVTDVLPRGSRSFHPSPS